MNTVPSGRDFEAYRLLRIDLKSTRDAAAELGISQTRIRQVVRRVELFLMETVPEVGAEQRRGRLELAQMIAAERLDALCGQMHRAFEASKGPQKTTRRVQTADCPPVTTVAVREGGAGDIRYALASLKLSAARAKIPALSLDSLIPYEVINAEEANPSAEDCSPPVERLPVTTAASPTPPRVTPPRTASWIPPSWDAIRPKSPLHAPAQPMTAAVNERRPLTKAERKARRNKLLARAS